MDIIIHWNRKTGILWPMGKHWYTHENLFSLPCRKAKYPLSVNLMGPLVDPSKWLIMGILPIYRARKLVFHVWNNFSPWAKESPFYVNKFIARYIVNSIYLELYNIYVNIYWWRKKNSLLENQKLDFQNLYNKIDCCRYFQLNRFIFLTVPRPATPHASMN